MWSRSPRPTTTPSSPRWPPPTWPTSCSACSPSKPEPPRPEPPHARSTSMTLVAAAQFGPVIGDLDANRETAAQAVRDAAAQGARLVVLPELADSGYVFSGPDEARGLATRVTDS